MMSSNSSNTQVFASVTNQKTFCLVWRYPSATSVVPQLAKTEHDSFFSLLAKERVTFSVNNLVRRNSFPQHPLECRDGSQVVPSSLIPLELLLWFSIDSTCTHATTSLFLFLCKRQNIMVQSAAWIHPLLLFLKKDKSTMQCKLCPEQKQLHYSANILHNFSALQAC